MSDDPVVNKLKAQKAADARAKIHRKWDLLQRVLESALEMGGLVYSVGVPRKDA